MSNKKQTVDFNGSQFSIGKSFQCTVFNLYGDGASVDDYIKIKPTEKTMMKKETSFNPE